MRSIRRPEIEPGKHRHVEDDEPKRRAFRPRPGRPRPERANSLPAFRSEALDLRESPSVLGDAG